MFSKADNFDSQDGESLIERKEENERRGGSRLKLVTAAKEVVVLVGDHVVVFVVSMFFAVVFIVVFVVFTVVFSCFYCCGCFCCYCCCFG